VLLHTPFRVITHVPDIRVITYRKVLYIFKMGINFSCFYTRFFVLLHTFFRAFTHALLNFSRIFPFKYKRLQVCGKPLTLT